MQKIGFTEKEAIKALIRNTLDRLTKKLDPSVGRLHFFLNMTKDAEESCVVVSFDNNDKVTNKDVKLITRELRDLIDKTYKIKLTVSCLVPKLCETYTQLTEKLNAYHDTPVLVHELIDRDTLLQALETMITSDNQKVKENLSKAIHEFLFLIYEKNSPFHPASLRKIFTDFLWPDLEIALLDYPDQAGDMSRMSTGAIDYTHRVMHDINTQLVDIGAELHRCELEAPGVFAIISQFKATCNQIPMDCPAIVEVLNLPVEEDSIKRLTLLLEQAKTALQISLRDDSARENAYRHGLRMLMLIRKLANFTRYVIQQDKVDLFSHLFGEEWFCFNTVQNPEFYQKIYELFSERFTNYAIVFTCYHSSCAMYSQLIAILTVQLGQLTHKWEVVQANRVKLPIEAKPKEPRSVNERSLTPSVEAPPVPISFSHVPHVTENIKAESIKLSQQLEERKREKLLAKQSRIFTRLHSGSPVEFEPEGTPPEDWFTLLITTSEGESDEVDISALAKADVQADYFYVNENSIVLIKGSPIEEAVFEPLRQVLFSNAGRGFMSDTSRGENGIKLFKQAKRESFAVIKGRDELRLVCARKKLTRQRTGSEFEIFVPFRTYPNHHAYEQFINQPDAALRLRQELEKKLTIIEIEPRYTPAP